MDSEPLFDNRTVLRLIYAGVFCIVLLLLRIVVLGDAKVTRLAPAAPLEGIVSQALTPSGGPLAQPGDSFTIQGVTYFNNNSWAVVNVTQTSGTNNTVYLVIRQKDGAYQAVLGPGTAFASSYLQSMPADVANFLSSKGLVYEPTN